MSVRVREGEGMHIWMCRCMYSILWPEVDSQRVHNIKLIMHLKQCMHRRYFLRGRGCLNAWWRAAADKVAIKPMQETDAHTFLISVMNTFANVFALEENAGDVSTFRIDVDHEERSRVQRLLDLINVTKTNTLFMACRYKFIDFMSSRPLSHALGFLLCSDWSFDSEQTLNKTKIENKKLICVRLCGRKNNNNFFNDATRYKNTYTERSQTHC